MASISTKNTIKNLNSKITELDKKLKTETNDQIIIILTKEKQGYLDDIDQLEQAQQEEALKKGKQLKTDLVNLITNLDLVYMTVSAHYIFILNLSTNKSKINLTEYTIKQESINGTLNHLIQKPNHFDDLKKADLIGCFQQAKSTYIGRTSSFNDELWDKRYAFNIMNVWKKYWAPIDSGNDYNPLFDLLMYSICGGKQENINYLEKWIAYKFCYPERNINIPGLYITGQPGGNGKGILILLLQSVFTEYNVGGITLKSLKGGFNASEEGKVITVIDDEESKNSPSAALKQRIGNRKVAVERKGQDTYEAENTSSWIVTDNIGNLIKLSGGGSGGEDRRWSILKTNVVLLEYLMEVLSTEDAPLDLVGAKDLAEEIANLSDDRVEVGKWLLAMIGKHNVSNMTTIEAHHADDYKERLEEQKDEYSDVFDIILPIFLHQGLIPNEYVKQIVESKTGKDVNARTISSRFSDYLSRNGVKDVHALNASVAFTNNKGTKLGSKQCRYKSIGTTNNTFNYQTISNKKWSKSAKVTVECLAIDEFSTDMIVGELDSINKTLFEEATFNLQSRLNNMRGSVV